MDNNTIDNRREFVVTIYNDSTWQLTQARDYPLTGVDSLASGVIDSNGATVLVDNSGLLKGILRQLVNTTNQQW